MFVPAERVRGLWEWLRGGWERVRVGAIAGALAVLASIVWRWRGRFELYDDHFAHGRESDLTRVSFDDVESVDVSFYHQGRDARRLRVDATTSIEPSREPATVDQAEPHSVAKRADAS